MYRGDRIYVRHPRSGQRRRKCGCPFGGTCRSRGKGRIKSEWPPSENLRKVILFYRFLLKCFNCNYVLYLSRYGHHVTLVSYYLCYDPVTIKRIFERLRNFDKAPNTVSVEPPPSFVVNDKSRRSVILLVLIDASGPIFSTRNLWWTGCTRSRASAIWRRDTIRAEQMAKPSCRHPALPRWLRSTLRTAWRRRWGRAGPSPRSSTTRSSERRHPGKYFPHPFSHDDVR